MLVQRCLTAGLMVTCMASAAMSQTTIGGSSLAQKSVGGFGGGSDWVLDENGYVGTYIDLASPGDVTISVEASGQSGGGATPHMNIVLADTKAGFDVGGGFSDYEHTFSLPAGTYFLRTEFNNDVSTASRELTVRDLTVTGATVSNSFSSSTRNANALAASNTYIDNFRKGNVTVGLQGASPGTEVQVSLKNHAFNFGTAVAGGNFSSIMNPHPTPGSDADKYQEALKTLFNAMVPENAGKWGENEFTQNSPWHPQLDKIVDFAADNDKRLRMHNLIWGTQQPNWVSNGQQNGLRDLALSQGEPYVSQLRQAISNRIDYYVGDGVGADPAQQYVELDVYNESYHTTQYWNVYGPDGIADIYNEVAQAVADAGAETRLFTNEYNVLQDGGDQYGNWYRQNIEAILNENGAVTGIGIQSYENNNIGTNNGAHFPARKMETLQNLSVLGLPLTLTEFGVKDPTNETDAATMLEETMRLMFGTADASGFFMWGFWRGDIYRGAAALYDQNWNLTEPGQLWLDLMDEWDTQLTAEVGPDGSIQFDGFWGDYELTIGGETFDLELIQGTTEYALAVGPELPGDYNGDGVVDAADYAVWRDAQENEDMSLLNRDPNKDNGTDLVDEDDYAYWRANFGMTAGPGAGAGSSVVPEPATAVLLLIGALAALFGRRRLDCLRP